MVETKITLRTTEVDGHTHERFFPEGEIAADTYRTTEDDGHFHFFVVPDDVEPGESTRVRTSPPDGREEGHQHDLRVRAVSEEVAAHEPPREKCRPSQVETKLLGGHVVETKEREVNGIRVGVVDGYISAWARDTGGAFGVPDQFAPGAFAESLAEHRSRGNRQIRLKDQHGRVIGGFPIETAREDSIGLRAEGHINLETHLGAEAWALIRQGVLTDMSIGFTSLEDVIEGGIRTIFEALVWEGSIVDEPANRDARILEIKAVVPFQDLPLADRGRAWDSSAAVGRVRTATGSSEAPSSRYKNAFLWYDREDAENFGAYKLPIADAVDGRLTAIPRGIFAATGALQGARGGVDIPSADRAGVIRNLERYYAKMDLESPFEREERQFVGVEEVKAMDLVELESALRRGVAFSKGAARVLTSSVAASSQVSEPSGVSYGSDDIRSLLDNLAECKRLLRDGRVLRS